MLKALLDVIIQKFPFYNMETMGEWRRATQSHVMSFLCLENGLAYLRNFKYLPCCNRVNMSAVVNPTAVKKKLTYFDQ